MVGISSHTLETIDDQFAQRAHIRVEGWVVHDANRSGFGEQCFDFIILGMPASPIGTAAIAVGVMQLVTAPLGASAHAITQLDCLFDQFDKAISVKIGVGDGGKECLGDEKISLVVLNAHAATACTPE